MSTEHTPGPWRVSADGNDVENVSGAGVCTMYADETEQANARLIAAAPDLLRACERAVKWINKEIIPAGEPDDGMAPAFLYEAIRDATSAE